MKKEANWYYKEFDKVEKKIKECKDEKEIKKLNRYLDKLDNEFYELEVED